MEKSKILPRNLGDIKESTAENNLERQKNTLKDIEKSIFYYENILKEFKKK